MNEPWLTAVVPETVAVADSAESKRIDTPFEEELAGISGRAAGKRHREFAAGRTCARRAAARLGCGPAAIPIGEQGCPTWPAGLTGSITHCRSYWAAAAARSSHVASIGIDAEISAQITDRLTERIALRSELRQISGLASEIPWGRVLFSAKESVYKAWYPLAHRRLRFKDVHVVFNAATQSLRADLLVDGPIVAGRRLEHFNGRFDVTHGVILTAFTVPAGGTWVPETHPAS